jgi:hypothetical protein
MKYCGENKKEITKTRKTGFKKENGRLHKYRNSTTKSTRAFINSYGQINEMKSWD